jgi:hypothetical protein
VIFPSHLPIANFHLHFRCTKPKAQEFEGMRHATAHFVGKDRVIQPLFLDQEQVALWKVALEAMTAEIAKGGALPWGCCGWRSI